MNKGMELEKKDHCSKPTISVATPVRNGRKFIVEAVSSVLDISV